MDTLKLENRLLNSVLLSLFFGCITFIFVVYFFVPDIAHALLIGEGNLGFVSSMFLCIKVLLCYMLFSLDLCCLVSVFKEYHGKSRLKPFNESGITMSLVCGGIASFTAAILFSVIALLLSKDIFDHFQNFVFLHTSCYIICFVVFVVRGLSRESN